MAHHGDCPSLAVPIPPTSLYHPEKHFLLIRFCDASIPEIYFPVLV